MNLRWCHSTSLDFSAPAPRNDLCMQPIEWIERNKCYELKIN